MLACLKQGSQNMVLVVLLQIGAKDLTVPPPRPPVHMHGGQGTTKSLRELRAKVWPQPSKLSIKQFTKKLK